MNDEHEGMGGSYTVDPKTGKRTLVQRTEDRKPEAAPAPATEPTPEKAGKEGN